MLRDKWQGEVVRGYSLVMPHPETGLPLVSFTGQSTESRTTYMAEAKANGWDCWGKPTELVDILVKGDDFSPVRVAYAERRGIPVISYEQWAETMLTGEIPNREGF